MSTVEQLNEWRHEVQQPLILRLIFVVAGAFAIIISVWELWRGIWPLNVTTPFFGLIVAGAFMVGGNFILAGLFGQALSWHVTPGFVEIEARAPLRRKRVRYGLADIEGFSIREHDWDSGPATWSVVMVTRDGQRYETRSFGNRTTAEKLRSDIATLSGYSSPQA